MHRNGLSERNKIPLHLAAAARTHLRHPPAQHTTPLAMAARAGAPPPSVPARPAAAAAAAAASPAAAAAGDGDRFTIVGLPNNALSFTNCVYVAPAAAAALMPLGEEQLNLVQVNGKAVFRVGCVCAPLGRALLSRPRALVSGASGLASLSLCPC